MLLTDEKINKILALAQVQNGKMPAQDKLTLSQTKLLCGEGNVEQKLDGQYFADLRKDAESRREIAQQRADFLSGLFSIFPATAQRHREMLVDWLKESPHPDTINTIISLFLYCENESHVRKLRALWADNGDASHSPFKNPIFDQHFVGIYQSVMVDAGHIYQLNQRAQLLLAALARYSQIPSGGNPVGEQEIRRALVISRYNEVFTGYGLRHPKSIITRITACYLTVACEDEDAASFIQKISRCYETYHQLIYGVIQQGDLKDKNFIATMQGTADKIYKLARA